MQNKPIKEDDLDLAEVAKAIWAGRKFILRVTGIFFILGIIMAFTSEVEYEASCKLMPEFQDGMERNLNGLGGLAGLAGINLDIESSGNLAPKLYPEIVNSIPFQVNLIHQPIKFYSLDSVVSSYTYFKKIDRHFLYGWLGDLSERVKKIFVPDGNSVVQKSIDDIIHLSKDDWELLEDYKRRLNVVVNDETGIITVTAEMPDPYAAAKMVDLVVEKLTEEITKYEIEKIRINLEFIQERYEEAKAEYQEKQGLLANFADHNKNLASSLVQEEYQRLQNELNIAFEVYKSLASQLEHSKIRVKEKKMAVFTILEPVKVPVEKSKPNRLFVILTGILMGFFIGILTLLIFEIIKSLA